MMMETNNPGKKEKKLSLRKAPQAPKRFSSSFILYYTEMKVQIKADIGGKASVRPMLCSLVFSDKLLLLFIFVYSR